MDVLSGVPWFSRWRLGPSIQEPRDYFPYVGQLTSDLLCVPSWALIGCGTKLQVMGFESRCSPNDNDVWTRTKVNLGFSRCSSSVNYSKLLCAPWTEGPVCSPVSSPVSGPVIGLASGPVSGPVIGSVSGLVSGPVPSVIQLAVQSVSGPVSGPISQRTSQWTSQQSGQ